MVVVTAGTADLPVAEECRATLRAFGFEAALIADVGVAGVHRLLAHAALLQAADAVVVVAGMEGALASVVGGLTRRPVVAVPTSVGYGAALRGSPRCWRCCRRAPRAWSWSGSTTVSGPRSRFIASSAGGPASHDRAGHDRQPPGPAGLGQETGPERAGR